MFGKACQHVILSPLNGHYGGGQFNGGRMVLQRWSVKSRENDHVNLVSLMERE